MNIVLRLPSSKRFLRNEVGGGTCSINGAEFHASAAVKARGAGAPWTATSPCPCTHSGVEDAPSCTRQRQCSLLRDRPCLVTHARDAPLCKVTRVRREGRASAA